jgi:hypothetical protein
MDPAHKVPLMGIAAAARSTAIVGPLASVIPAVASLVTPPLPAIPFDPLLQRIEGSAPPIINQPIPTFSLASSRVPVHTAEPPTFFSHITPVFTAQMAIEEQLREDVRRREATRLVSNQKINQTVVIYAWIEVYL